MPRDAVRINRPFSFYETYRQQIWLVIALLIANITRRKNGEHALRRSENRFRQLADAIWEALGIHDNGVLLEANKMFEAFYGYQLEELLRTQIVPIFFLKNTRIMCCKSMPQMTSRCMRQWQRTRVE